jgi:lysine-specific permease
VFWRILLFYILAMAVISFIIPYTDPRLIHASTSNLAMSPFTIVFKEFGLPFAASIMNAIILIAVLSAANASLYSSTRIFWHMAQKKHAPQLFAKVNRQGVPVKALFITALFGCLVFLSSIFGNGQIFMWLVNISSLSGFVAWLGIAVSHYRFRKAYVAQGKKISDLPYRAKLFPFGAIFAFILCLIIILGQEYGMFLSGHFKLLDFLSTYIGVIIFLVLWFAYKWIKKTKLVPLENCDFEHNF